MNIDDNIKKEFSAVGNTAATDAIIDQKLDELITLLSASPLDSKRAQELQQRFTRAVDNSITNRDRIDAFKALDDKADSSREEMLDEFSFLLSTHQVDSNISRQYLKSERIGKIVLAVIGVVMITLGFAMIVMPAPPYFEMFTIYYFNQNDGVTLMDLISLLVILTGIYLFIRSVTKSLSLKK